MRGDHTSTRTDQPHCTGGVGFSPVFSVPQGRGDRGEPGAFLSVEARRLGRTAIRSDSVVARSTNGTGGG